jgi:type II restriction enzyme
MRIRLEKTGMTADKPYLLHLNSFSDLITTHEEIRAAFVSAALEKNRRATPFVEEARDLKVKASCAHEPNDLLNIPGIASALVTAASVSDKAYTHFSDEDKLVAVHVLIEKFLDPAGENFVEELVYRFLLTRGDSLGGSMRNWVGVIAQHRVIRALIASLANAGIPFYWLDRNSDTWIEGSRDDPDIELSAKGISWQRGEEHRTLLFNISVPFIGKPGNNVDFSLFQCGYGAFVHVPSSESPKQHPDQYIALGELKGGIDPAGGDEHWKTAGSAFTRIRRSFSLSGHTPASFFIGAAIPHRMAEELWEDLEAGTLSNAANLTNRAHLASLCGWLCAL